MSKNTLIIDHEVQEIVEPSTQRLKVVTDALYDLAVTEPYLVVVFLSV